MLSRYELRDPRLEPARREPGGLLELIRQIVAGRGRKYTSGNVDRSRYDRLVDLGWLTPFKTNISDVEYHVADKGRAAAAF